MKRLVVRYLLLLHTWKGWSVTGGTDGHVCHLLVAPAQLGTMETTVGRQTGVLHRGQRCSLVGCMVLRCNPALWGSYLAG